MSNMTHEAQTWKERYEALVAKAKERGATITSDFIDYDHLDVFWYDENGVIKVFYKDYSIEFDAYGEIVCDIETEVIKKPENGKPMYQVSTIRNMIENDAVLTECINNGKITLNSNNWINIIVLDENGEEACEPADSNYTNLVEALEEVLTDYLDYIDELAS